MQTIYFESEEEWYLFLDYLRTLHISLSKAYNFGTKNFIGKRITKKENMEMFSLILDLTDKLLVTFRNEEPIVLKTLADIEVYKYITNPKNLIVKCVLVSYKLADKNNYEKLEYLLNRIYLQLSTNLGN